MVASRKDLIVLVPDMDIESVLTELLNRPADLGIRELRYDIRRHPLHDSGCATKAAEFLRNFLTAYRYAIVCFDYEGSGREGRPSEKVARTVRMSLERNGWKNRCEVIVLVPELETWIWTGTPQVAKVLGWQGGYEPLRRWLIEKGFWKADDLKPFRPKEAVEAVLRRTTKRRSSSLYARIARNANPENCRETEFARLWKTLQGWFGVA